MCFCLSLVSSLFIGPSLHPQEDYPTTEIWFHTLLIHNPCETRDNPNCGLIQFKITSNKFNLNIFTCHCHQNTGKKNTSPVQRKLPQFLGFRQYSNLTLDKHCSLLERVRPLPIEINMTAKICSLL